MEALTKLIAALELLAEKAKQEVDNKIKFEADGIKIEKGIDFLLGKHETYTEIITMAKLLKMEIE